MKKTNAAPILYISDSTTWGGSERYLVDVITHFSKLTKTELLFIGPGCAEMEMALANEAVKIHYLPSVSKFKLYLSLWKFLLKYRSWLLHTNLTYYDACQSVPISLFFLPFTRCIATIHGLVPKPQLNKIQKIKRKLREKLFNRYNLVMSPSGYVAKEIIKNWGVDKYRVKVVYNGVYTVEIKPDPDPREDHINILYLGRLSAEKGLIYLIEALNKLDPKTYHCYLVGDGPDREEIASLVDKFKLTPNISFEGFHANTSPFLNKADVLVLPSLYENFPLVILEAMSCGIPTVASRVGGIPEQIFDGETGVLVPSKDSSALANALQLLSHDPEAIKRMGAAAKMRFEENFTLKIMIENIAQCYRRVMT